VRASDCWADTYVSCSCFLCFRAFFRSRPQEGRQGYARPPAVSIDAPDDLYSVTLYPGKSRFGSSFL
jgi:hypothetical protein